MAGRALTLVVVFLCGIWPGTGRVQTALERPVPGSIPSDPYLTASGQTSDIVIDSRFVPGPYEPIRTPHAPVRMNGRILVEPHP